MSPSHPTTAPGRRRTGWIVAGIVAVVVGVGVAIAGWFVAESQVGRAASGLARAPAGCDTTLEFTDTGTFVVFVETTGRLDEVPGACEAPTRYDHDGELPAVDVAVTGPDGRSVAIVETSVESYATGSFAGEPIGEIVIDGVGRYVVRVQSDATTSDLGTSDAGTVVVSVGRDPSAAGGAVRLIGLIGGAVIALSGLLAAIVGIATRGSTSDGSDDRVPSQPTNTTPAVTTPVAPPTGPPIAPPVGPPPDPPPSAPGGFAPPSGPPVG